MSNDETFNAFNLKEQHKTNLTKFISFIKSKEKKVINEIGYFIDDFYDENVQDTVYNQKDIKQLLNDFQEKFKSSIQGELNYFTNLSAVYTQLVFHNAETKNVILDIETSQAENMNNMKQMNDLVELMSSSNIPDIDAKKGIGKLSSISSTQNLISDYEELLQTNKFISTELENLKQKTQILSEENYNLKTRNEEFAQEMNSMSDKIKNLSGSSGSKTDSEFFQKIKQLEKELSDTKNNLDIQIDKYHKATNDFDKKLSECTQFKQLKKFLQEKNQMVIDLKKKLANYEK